MHNLEEEYGMGILRKEGAYGGEEDAYKMARREILRIQSAEKEDAIDSPLPVPPCHFLHVITIT